MINYASNINLLDSAKNHSSASFLIANISRSSDVAIVHLDINERPPSPDGLTELPSFTYVHASNHSNEQYSLHTEYTLLCGPCEIDR